jgi:hypothetical protein
MVGERLPSGAADQQQQQQKPWKKQAVAGAAAGVVTAAASATTGAAKPLHVKPGQCNMLYNTECVCCGTCRSICMPCGPTICLYDAAAVGGMLVRLLLACCCNLAPTWAASVVQLLGRCAGVGPQQ